MVYLYILHGLFSFLAIYIFVRDYPKNIKPNFSQDSQLFMLLLTITPILNIFLIAEVIEDE